MPPARHDEPLPLEAVRDLLGMVRAMFAAAKQRGAPKSELAKITRIGKKLSDAKEASKAGKATPAQKDIVAADQTGDRRTLKADSFIPLTMAVIYLGILLYFKSIGGYRAVHLAGTSAAKT